MSQISLLPYNTFNIDASASSLISITSTDVLKDVLNTKSHLPRRVLGGGSNILLTKNIEAEVLLNKIKGIRIIEENEDCAIIEFGAGETWHDCVLWAIDNNLGGIENLSLIPGTIGAAPIQNIGAYGVELKDVFHSLDAIHLHTHQQLTFHKSDCEFGYRESIFKKEPYKESVFIVSVRLQLTKKHVLRTSYGSIQEELNKRGISHPTIKDVSDVVIFIRESKLPNPKEIGNAGSFFKNPVISQEHFKAIQGRYPDMPFFAQEHGVKVPAAWLIETLKWKGYRHGDYGVHRKQALVLVNYGKASGQEILDLSTNIITSVKQEFNIELEREVNVW